MRQELASELGIVVSLRTMERAVSHLRRELAAEALVTVRFETPPGRQLQIDFGERRIVVGGEPVKVHLFVATLGYSRPVYRAALRHDRIEAPWILDGPMNGERFRVYVEKGSVRNFVFGVQIGRKDPDHGAPQTPCYSGCLAGPIA